MSPFPSARFDPGLLHAVLAALRAALALVSPCDCAGCGAPDVEFCSECRARLRPALLVAELADGTPFVSALSYEGMVRDVVLAFKQTGRYRLANELGPSLRAALVEVARGAEDAGAEPIAVLGVPPSRAGSRARGYDPVELLVRAAGGVVARPRLSILRSGLIGRGGTQKSRSRDDRLRSRVGTVRCPGYWAGRRVVVVDDVATTGATLAEAVRAARAAGADVVGACALAATPLMSAKVP